MVRKSQTSTRSRRTSRPTIRGRDSSLAAAFVHAIIPRYVDEDRRAALYKDADVDRTICIYCGEAATDDDHFRSLVREGRPSGFFHNAENLVPSCGPCNQSKGGSDWKEWMDRSPPESKRRRNPDLGQRMMALKKFEAAVPARPVSLEAMREVVGREIWDSYWQRLDQIKALMSDADESALVVRAALQKAFGTWAETNR